MAATMGSHDDQLPMAMSRALLRRFAFVEVPSPDDDAFAALLEGPGEIVRRLLPLRAVRDIGPAVFLDAARFAARRAEDRSEEHTSELQSLMRISYAVFCLKKQK